MVLGVDPQPVGTLASSPPHWTAVSVVEVAAMVALWLSTWRAQPAVGRSWIIGVDPPSAPSWSPPN